MTKPQPLSDEHSRRYWEALSEGRLLIQRCSSCGAHQFYPRRHCASCFAPDPDWVEASGQGRLHTFSVVQRSANPEFAGDCPYVLGIIELDEGVRLTARVAGPAGLLRCDAPVRIVFSDGDSDPATPPPWFVLEEAG